MDTSSPHTTLCRSRFHPRPHSPYYLLVRTNKSAPCTDFYHSRGHKHRWRVQCPQHPDGSHIRCEGPRGEVRGISHLRFPPLASRPCPLSPCPLYIMFPPGRRTACCGFWPGPTEQALGQMAKTETSQWWRWRLTLEARVAGPRCMSELRMSTLLLSVSHL